MLDQLAHRERHRIPLHPANARLPRLRLRLLLGALMSIAVAALVILNRIWILDAVGLARTAQPFWLLVALVLMLLSYLVSSQVFRVVLRSLGYRVGVFRMWATTLVAIVMSQSLPAGGVGSYAFLLGAFKRRGVSSGQAALVASLEALSYAGAMLLVCMFSLIFLATRTLATGAVGASFLVPMLAGLFALLVIGGAVFVLTRSEATLMCWLLALKNGLARSLRRSWGDAWAGQIVTELARGRALIAGRRRTLVLLVFIQFVALCGHSLAMLLILVSLGAGTSFAVVLAAFGIALITGTFNVLPGGGGTVETVLAAVLTQLTVGPAAVPAAILFRLLGFWLLLPAVAGCYYWLMRDRPARRATN